MFKEKFNIKTPSQVAAVAKLCLFGLIFFQRGRIRHSETFLDEANSFQVLLSFAALTFRTGHTGIVSLCYI